MPRIICILALEFNGMGTYGNQPCLHRPVRCRINLSSNITQPLHPMCKLYSPKSASPPVSLKTSRKNNFSYILRNFSCNLLMNNDKII